MLANKPLPRTPQHLCWRRYNLYRLPGGGTSAQISGEEFAATSRQIFATSGYDSPEKVMQLIHEVKQELLTEREQRLTDGKIHV